MNLIKVQIPFIFNIQTKLKFKFRNSSSFQDRIFKFLYLTPPPSSLVKGKTFVISLNFQGFWTLDSKYINLRSFTNFKIVYFKNSISLHSLSNFRENIRKKINQRLFKNYRFWVRFSQFFSLKSLEILQNFMTLENVLNFMTIITQFCKMKTKK